MLPLHHTAIWIGTEGVEPPYSVPKTDVLPLDDVPVWSGNGGIWTHAPIDLFAFQANPLTSWVRFRMMCWKTSRIPETSHIKSFLQQFYWSERIDIIGRGCGTRTRKSLVLSQLPMPIRVHPHLSTGGGTWTHKSSVLSRFPMPIRIHLHLNCLGWIRTNENGSFKGYCL